MLAEGLLGPANRASLLRELASRASKCHEVDAGLALDNLKRKENLNSGVQRTVLEHGRKNVISR